MVMCEVGFKCPACVGRIKSHVTDVEPVQYVIGIALTLVVSQLFGWLYPILLGIPFLRILGLPIVGYLLAYVIGQALGKGVHVASGRKLSRKLMGALLIAFLVGLYFGPIGELVTNAIVFLWQSAMAPESLLHVGSSSLLFILGLIIQLLVPYCFWQGYKTPFSRP